MAMFSVTVINVDCDRPVQFNKITVVAETPHDVMLQLHDVPTVPADEQEEYLDLLELVESPGFGWSVDCDAVIYLIEKVNS